MRVPTIQPFAGDATGVAGVTGTDLGGHSVFYVYSESHPMTREQATDPCEAMVSLMLEPGWFIDFTNGLTILPITGRGVEYSGHIV